MKKKISIVTPTFNEENNISNFVILFKEMAKFDKYEHIIIDNCSSDNTIQM